MLSIFESICCVFSIAASNIPPYLVLVKGAGGEVKEYEGFLADEAEEVEAFLAGALLFFVVAVVVAFFFVPLPAGRPTLPVPAFLGVVFFLGEVFFFTPALGLAAALVVVEVRFFAVLAVAVDFLTAALAAVAAALLGRFAAGILAAT